MKKEELVKMMAQISGLTENDSAAALNAFTESVGSSLKDKENVTLVGFGTWEVRERAARKPINPRTKEPLGILLTKP